MIDLANPAVHHHADKALLPAPRLVGASLHGHPDELPRE